MNLHTAVFTGYDMHDLILRLVMAGILAGIIGLERELRSKDAGLRTHFLVGIGSALIMIVSQYGFMSVIKYSHVVVDPSRIAAQVVSGIGFLGAGTIIINKKMVKGLTTAAGIWVAAGIGLACGSGLYLVATITTIAVLVGLEILQRVFKLNTHKLLELKVIFYKRPNNELSELLKQNKFTILSYNTEVERLEEHNSYYIKCQFKCRKNLDSLALVDDINKLHGVSYVNIESI